MEDLVKPKDVWLFTRVVDNFPIGIVANQEQAVNLLLHHYMVGDVKEVRVIPHQNITEMETIYFPDNTRKFGRKREVEEWVDIQAFGMSYGKQEFRLKKIVSLL
jgi:hypothetical protein